MVYNIKKSSINITIIGKSGYNKSMILFIYEEDESNDNGYKNKAELILALLFAGDQEFPTSIEGITRLEKLIFLLKEEKGFLKEKTDEDNFNFIPFKMGPWSSEVYDEVDFLESLGLINKDSNEKQSPADEAHNDELFDSMILDKYQKKVLFFLMKEQKYLN